MVLLGDSDSAAPLMVCVVAGVLLLVTPPAAASSVQAPQSPLPKSSLRRRRRGSTRSRCACWTPLPKHRPSGLQRVEIARRYFTIIRHLLNG
jgi:hypothetical protein